MLTVSMVTPIVQGAMTVLIAIITSYIAWQQWRLNERKFKLDLYDRRLKIYQEVKMLLDIMAGKARVTYKELLTFRSSVSEADFLFDAPVRAYLDELYSVGVKMEALNQKYERYVSSIEDGAERLTDDESDYLHQKLIWFVEQYKTAQVLFGKYIRLAD